MVFDRMGLLAGRAPARWRGLGRGARSLLLGISLLGGERAAGAKPDEGLLTVQRAALAHAGLSPGATASLLARQHLSGLLPQVRVTVGQGWQLSATGRPLDGLTIPAPDDSHTSYAVSASWDLSRLLVPREALQLHHDEPRWARQRLTLLVRVTRLVGARCRLLKAETLRESQQAQVVEFEAALDLLTGGVALPEVTSATSCPAVPRFKVVLTRRAPALRRASTIGRADDELGDDGDEDDDPLLELPGGSAEPSEYGEE